MNLWAASIDGYRVSPVRRGLGCVGRPLLSPHGGYRIKSGKSQGTPLRALSLVFPGSNLGPWGYGFRDHLTMGTGRPRYDEFRNGSQFT